MPSKSAIILAAGKGTRMKSDAPKVLCEVLFKPMISWVLDTCYDAMIENICVVTGYKGNEVKEILPKGVCTANQEKQLGTGHAVMMARKFLERNINGDVIVLCGDAPFMDSNTIENAYDLHKREKNAITVITARLQDPTGYGRVVRSHGGIERIVEQKDASATEVLINEVNSGAYWFNVRYLLDVLFEIDNGNSQGEYYLPDTIALSLKKGNKVGGYLSDNPNVILGANSRQQLLHLNNIARDIVIDELMENGVEFVSLDGIIIEKGVKIGKQTKIMPGSILRGKTIIGSGCEIGPNTLVRDSEIGDNVTLNSVQCYSSVVEEDATIGPFVHIRPNSHIKSGVHIGDFVEVKNSVIGADTHIAHLTYVGDSDVGKRVNFGCGTVTVNYNGVSKSRCTIGDDAFIGCNTNLIAPVEIGKGGYTAAGSTITEDVPGDALAIARARQTNKEGYSKKLRGE